MAIFFVRHARAGERAAWSAPDELRPLSDRGRRQATGLTDVLGGEPIKRIVSSPYVRCVQTVEPLARSMGLVVEVDDRLGEGASFEGVLDLITELPDDAVMCTHGDVLPDTIDALARRGMAVKGQADFRKGAWWHLERDGAIVTRGKAHPPPD